MVQSGRRATAETWGKLYMPGICTRLSQVSNTPTPQKLTQFRSKKQRNRNIRWSLFVRTNSSTKDCVSLPRILFNSVCFYTAKDGPRHVCKSQKAVLASGLAPLAPWISWQTHLRTAEPLCVRSHWDEFDLIWISLISSCGVICGHCMCSPRPKQNLAWKQVATVTTAFWVEVCHSFPCDLLSCFVSLNILMS